MHEYVINNESAIRLAIFLGIFICVALVEISRPRRVLTTSKVRRWIGNIGILIINTILLRLIFPSAAIGMAVWVEMQGWGIFNHIGVPYWLKIVFCAIALDFIIYLQHVMFHAVPLFWRLHMMHHADMDYDLTTGSRFHPIEIIISMCIKGAAISVLGAPPIAVIVFEILLNGTAMFNHGNFFIPPGIDRVLRWFVVTPDMHRVHHSIFVGETNSNFGFNLPWWDRIMGTYRAQPSHGHEGMTIGLRQFRDPLKLTLPWMLALPFIGKGGNYAINRRGAKAEDDMKINLKT
jgi:sterol desaturase/sphingolipid hydroxylase (fatty acid hydroxylase superfamily)